MPGRRKETTGIRDLLRYIQYSESDRAVEKRTGVIARRWHATAGGQPNEGCWKDPCHPGASCTDCWKRR